VKLSRTKLAIIAYISITLNSALVAWLSGFDYNHRGSEVATWYVSTQIIAVLVALAVKFMEF